MFEGCGHDAAQFQAHRAGRREEEVHGLAVCDLSRKTLEEMETTLALKQMLGEKLVALLS